jgi:hypothetical protein
MKCLPCSTSQPYPDIFFKESGDGHENQSEMEDQLISPCGKQIRSGTIFIHRVPGTQETLYSRKEILKAGIGHGSIDQTVDMTIDSSRGNPVDKLRQCVVWIRSSLQNLELFKRIRNVQSTASQSSR